jgi:glutamate/aspartate transport system substrate-binding protein
VLTSGAINGIYNTWFEKPIAPKGINLNIPISPSLKKVMAKPTDSPDPKVYE